MKDWVLGIVKFAAAVVLIPALIAVSHGFFRELHGLRILEERFYQGGAAYVLIHLFVFQPSALYQAGQKIFADVFRFSAWVSQSIPLAIPLYSTLLLLVYYITTTIFHMRGVEEYVMTALGFTLAMHLVLAAQELSESDAAVLKPHYWLTMSLTYMFSLTVVAALLALNFPQFSFTSFIDQAWSEGKRMYFFLDRQIFT